MIGLSWSRLRRCLAGSVLGLAVVGCGTVPALSGTKVEQLVAFLKAQVGKPYVYGATGPGSFDCSGLVMTAFSKIGIDLPRTSESQSNVGTRVSLDDLQPGDVLFWGAPGIAFHDAVYIGDGQYVAAENTRVGVVLYTLAFYRPDFARRIM